MDRVEQALSERGWAILPAAVPVDLLARLRHDLERVCAEQHEIQLRNGVDTGAGGTAHHLPCAGAVFLELLECLAALGSFDRYFGGPYILNTYGGLLNRPHEASYVGRVHRDQRTYSGDFRLMAQVLVMLDAFTDENGATFFLEGSHRRPGRPNDDDFFRRAVRALGDAGSIVMFDSRLWHAAGMNQSGRPRRALTLAFTRPFVKQQLDYPRALGDERAASLSPTLRQLLGYNARVPVSLNEWYQPPELRLYRRDQG